MKKRAGIAALVLSLTYVIGSSLYLRRIAHKDPADRTEFQQDVLNQFYVYSNKLYGV